MKILVVDDEKLLVKGITFNLQNEGYEVEAAYDGTAAVELARKECFVHAAAAARDGWVLMTVEDNGMGIPAEDMPHIFQRFYRVDKARSREIGGTGLGLSIVGDTVRRRCGEITVAAREGGGTVFTVRFKQAGEVTA